MNEPTERIDAMFLKSTREEHVRRFKCKDYSCIIERQELSAVNHYIRLLEAQWIDVSNTAILDALEDGTLVSIYVPDHPTLKVWPAAYNKETGFFTAGSHPPCAGWFQQNEITHFMVHPIPTIQMIEDTKDIEVSDT